MPASDRACGSVMLLAAAATFLYYTMWALVLPLIDDSSPVHTWFPSREWAVRIPAFIVTVGISAMGLFLGCRIVSDTSSRTQRATQPAL